MRVRRTYRTGQFLPPFAVASLAVLLAACHASVKQPAARINAGTSTGGTAEYQEDLVFNDIPHCIRWTIPGALEAKPEANPKYNAVAIFHDYGASFLSVADVGTYQPDEYALACAAIRGFNVEFPSASVRRLEPTQSNGALWYHYVFDGSNDKGPVRIVFDITRQGRNAITLVNFTLLKGPGKTSLWPESEMYKGISFGIQYLLTNLSKEERAAYNFAATRTYVQIGNSYIERKRPAEAETYYELAHLLNPGDSSLAVMLADSFLLERKFDKSLPRLDELVRLYPNDSNLVWRRAYVYGATGRNADAQREYERAIHTMGNQANDAVNSYLSYLDSVHELGARLDEVIALCEKNGDPSVQLYMARACLESGDSDRAKKIIGDIVAKCEAYPQLAEPLVSLYLDMDNYAEALRISETIIRQGNPVGHYLAAATLMREGRFKEARTYAATALEKLPTNRAVKELSDAINAQLGKADTTTFQTPIDPVPLPAEFASLIPAAPADFEDGFGSHNEYTGVLYDFSANRQLRTTLYGRFHVSSVSAIRRMNDLRFPFDPLYERVYVNYVRVYDDSGKQIAEGKLADYYTSNDSQQPLVSQKKELHIPIPSLAPGCTVEYATSFVTLGNQEKMPFKLRRLSQYIPTQLSFVGVRGDTGRVQYALANGAEKLDSADSGLLFFHASFPEPLTLYPDTPPGTLFIPSVWLGSKENTWASETKNYFDRIGALSNQDPAATEKARALLGEKFTKPDAVRILSAYVRESLTYQGLAFGVRAMVPNTCEDILHNRYGDCKDHSYLLMQLLRGAGIRASLALVDTSRDINTSIPDVGQFDHMVVYLPDYDGGWFIDTTNKVNSSEYQPFWLAGCPSLILDPDNPRIVPVPRNPREASGIDVVRCVRIGADGRAEIDETATFRGLWAGYLREILRDKSVSEYAPALTQSISLPEIASVKNIRAKNLDDLASNVVLEYSYAAEETYLITNEVMTGRIPASWEIDGMTLLNDQPVRRIPIWQSNEYAVTADTTLIPPDGYDISTPGIPVKLRNSTPFLSFEFVMSAEEKTLHATSKCVKNSGVFPASSRDARDAAYNEALAEIRIPIVLVKKPQPGNNP